MNDERAIRDLVQKRRPNSREPSPPRLSTRASRALDTKIKERMAELKAEYLAFKQDRRKRAVFCYLRRAYAIGQEFEGKGQSDYLMEQSEKSGEMKTRWKDTVFSYLLR